MTDDKIERKMLKKYLDAYKRQKSKAKEAAELLARVKTHYCERLYSNPLLEKLADLQVTVCYLELLEEQSALKSKVKEAETALDQFAYGKYPTLSVNEIKTLVVDDKWLPALTTAVRQELNRVSQTLTGRIRQLAERYETPLPQLTDLVADLSTRVKEHLANMGAV